MTYTDMLTYIEESERPAFTPPVYVSVTVHEIDKNQRRKHVCTYLIEPEAAKLERFDVLQLQLLEPNDSTTKKLCSWIDLLKGHEQRPTPRLAAFLKGALWIDNDIGVARFIPDYIRQNQNHIAHIASKYFRGSWGEHNAALYILEEDATIERRIRCEFVCI